MSSWGMGGLAPWSVCGEQADVYRLGNDGGRFGAGKFDNGVVFRGPGPFVSGEVNAEECSELEK